MKKGLSTLILTGFVLSGCSSLHDRNVERLYMESVEYDQYVNFTAEELEKRNQMAYCNAYALAHSFFVTSSDTYQSLTEKTLYYKMADVERFNEIVSLKNECYDAYGITKEDIDAVNSRLNERIEQLKKQG
jgi:phosphoribosyl-AMP cyclohydrolase